MKLSHFGCSAVLAGLLVVPVASGQTVSGAFAATYTATDLGSIAGVATPYGGLTLKLGDVNTLLIGGSANNSGGSIYSVGVIRDSGGHITGFSGPATHFATAPYIDGGLAYGPGSNLFFTGWPVNELGQIKPGSTSPDKTIDLSAEGVSSSVGSMVFAPNGDLKILSYNSSNWYTATLTPDGLGTYDVGTVTHNVTLTGGIEGAAYVPAGSVGFAAGSVLVAEYQANQIATYTTDAAFNPIASSRQTFITGLGGAEGAYIDPVTGDFLFSTFGTSNRVIVVTGFEKPVLSAPDGGSSAILIGIALGALALSRRRLCQ